MYPYLLLLAITFLLPPDNDNRIDWTANRKLVWGDFQGQPVQNSDNVALTSSHINFQFGYGGGKFTYSIRCSFDKKRSWARVKSDYILDHEQRHFDIAEIHARKLKKALLNYQYKEATAEKDVTAIHDRIMKEHHQMQATYDQETDHSRNESIQAKWEYRIDSTLKALVPFSKYK